MEEWGGSDKKMMEQDLLTAPGFSSETSKALMHLLEPSQDFYESEAHVYMR